MTDVTAEERSPEVAYLEGRVEQLETERKHLLAAVEILQGVASSLHFVDVMQTIVKKLGEIYGLDRCSIFLAERGRNKVRLVASYEDAGIRNYLVDLNRYPELRQALKSRETVLIPDAQSDPKLKHIKSILAQRNVKTIAVVPITWDDTVIGAIYLRTYIDGPSFSDADVRFLQVVGSLTAKALRNAYRFERLIRDHQGTAEHARTAELERTALVAYMQRLLNAFSARYGTWTDAFLPRASKEELDRLVDVAMAVFAEEGKGP